MPEKRKRSYVPSRAAVTLALILETDNQIAAAIRDAIHYTQLWRYRTGAGRPSYETMVMLRKLTRGRIKESNWHEPVIG